ncbi:hypothetical protein E4U13_003872 [Claviceps humidiphila]|uniref:Uncharacterized protein n=1 Tax=Claviceps humidiphila TaxID=1294629 RepID=A0A9P7Q9X1_9HYPO|nr:hypothetical protein E4U13_003872 [Claviceps humidiphila]
MTMAEIEMDVDIASLYRTAAQSDDDFIDYDTDAENALDHEDQPEFIPDVSLYEKENTNSRQPGHDDVAYLEKEEEDPSQTLDTQNESVAVESLSPGHEPSHEIDYDVEDESIMQTVGGPSETLSLAAGEQDLGDISRVEDTLAIEEAEDQTEDQVEDQAGDRTEEQTEEQTEKQDEDQDETQIEDNQVQAEHYEVKIGNHEGKVEDYEVQIETHEVHVEEHEVQVDDQVENQEISWETEHDELERKLESSIKESHSTTAANNHKDQKYDEQQDKAHADFAEESGYTKNQALDEGVDGNVDEGLDETEAVEAGENHGEGSDTDSNQYPAITVQYNGDEFPCFSANSDGFFSHLSLLDESMQTVLESFRKELENELLDGDELVFQVDELGLEFSESSSQDLLASITLRQATEIFDVLVKNQDPDGTRPLYTYLFTRPSTSKRFDFLMESAAEGKGLDQVIHLFEPPMAHAHVVDIGDDSVTEDIEMQIGEFDSAEDDELMETIHDIDMLYSEAQMNGLNAGDDEMSHQGELISGSSPTGAGEGHQSAEDEIVVSGALAAEDDVGDGEEVVQVEEEASFVARSTPAAHDASDATVGSEHSEVAAPAAGAAVELERGEADEMLGIDFDDEPVDLTAMNGAGAGRDEVEHQVTQDTQDTQHTQHTNDDENTDAQVNGASTTITSFKDDVNIQYAPTELGTISGGADELMANDEYDEDAEGEIDWRDDEPETLLDDVDEYASSNTAKRARCEVENDAGDDQSQFLSPISRFIMRLTVILDAKRRRS